MQAAATLASVLSRVLTSRRGALASLSVVGAALMMLLLSTIGFVAVCLRAGALAIVAMWCVLAALASMPADLAVAFADSGVDVLVLDPGSPVVWIVPALALWYVADCFLTFFGLGPLVRPTPSPPIGGPTPNSG